MPSPTPAPIYREFEGAKVRVSVGLFASGNAVLSLQNANSVSVQVSIVLPPSDLAGIRDAINAVLAETQAGVAA